MENGVGSGARARLWLDRFQAYDAEKGSGYYPRLKFLLGDYSPATLDTALAAVGPHAPLCSVIPIDATNPFKVLSFLRFKILFVHLTNVYDNLTFDEIARRDRKSTRLNSSHSQISYAVFCLKKKNNNDKHLSEDKKSQ